MTALLYELALLSTGAGLSAFIIAHETLLSAVWRGGAAMDSLALDLERTRLVRPGVAAIAVLIVVHALVALRRLPLKVRELAAYLRVAGRMPHWDTISWGFQALTAAAVAVLASMHFATAGWDLPIAAAKSAARVARLAPTGFYDLLLTAVAVHTALGLERIATKWGGPGRGPARWTAWALCAAIMVAGFVTLVAFHRIARGG